MCELNKWMIERRLMLCTYTPARLLRAPQEMSRLGDQFCFPMRTEERKWNEIKWQENEQPMGNQNKEREGEWESGLTKQIN